MNSTQHFLSFYATASYLYTYTKLTYSLSRCRLPTFVLGPFLLGGGDTSTTSGDGGGISTTSGDEQIEMMSSSLQYKIRNTQSLHVLQTSTFEIHKRDWLTMTTLTNLLMLTGFSVLQCKEQ